MSRMRDVAPFLAGVGTGLAAAVLLAPDAGDKTRNRIRGFANQGLKKANDAVTNGIQDVRDAADRVAAKGTAAFNDQQQETEEAMSNLKDKAKEKIDDAATAAKQASAIAVDKAREAAHQAGKKMEEGGKRLQNA